MPRISEFFGIVIYLYYQDQGVHHTPHFHAEYAGDEVVVSIPDAEVPASSLPAKKKSSSKLGPCCEKPSCNRREPPRLKANRLTRSNLFPEPAMPQAIQPPARARLTPRVETVEALDGYALRVTFATGEVRHVDCRPFLDKGVFRALRDKEAFGRAEPINGGGGIGWPSGADLSRDTVYLAGTPV